MKRYALQSLCSSRSLISVFCALYAWTAGGALAASAPEDEAVLEARAAQAEKVLADRSFYERWKEPSAIDSVKTAAQVKSDAEGVLKQIEEALAVQRSWCGQKFLSTAALMTLGALHLTANARSARSLWRQTKSSVSTEWKRCAQNRKRMRLNLVGSP